MQWLNYEVKPVCKINKILITLTAESFCVRWRIPLPPTTSSTDRLQPCYSQIKTFETLIPQTVNLQILEFWTSLTRSILLFMNKTWFIAPDEHHVPAHHEFTREGLFIVADEIFKRLKKLDHAVILLECCKLLKCLLNHLPQGPRLDHSHRDLKMVKLALLHNSDSILICKGSLINCGCLFR